MTKNCKRGRYSKVISSFISFCSTLQSGITWSSHFFRCFVSIRDRREHGSRVGTFTPFTVLYTVLLYYINETQYSIYIKWVYIRINIQSKLYSPWFIHPPETMMIDSHNIIEKTDQCCRPIAYRQNEKQQCMDRLGPLPAYKRNNKVCRTLFAVAFELKCQFVFFLDPGYNKISIIEKNNT